MLKQELGPGGVWRLWVGHLSGPALNRPMELAGQVSRDRAPSRPAGGTQTLFRHQKCHSAQRRGLDRLLWESTRRPFFAAVGRPGVAIGRGRGMRTRPGRPCCRHAGHSYDLIKLWNGRHVHVGRANDQFYLPVRCTASGWMAGPARPGSREEGPSFRGNTMIECLGGV